MADALNQFLVGLGAKASSVSSSSRIASSLFMFS